MTKIVGRQIELDDLSLSSAQTLTQDMTAGFEEGLLQVLEKRGI